MGSRLDGAPCNTSPERSQAPVSLRLIDTRTWDRSERWGARAQHPGADHEVLVDQPWASRSFHRVWLPTTRISRPGPLLSLRSARTHLPVLRCGCCATVMSRQARREISRSNGGEVRVSAPEEQWNRIRR